MLGGPTVYICADVLYLAPGHQQDQLLPIAALIPYHGVKQFHLNYIYNLHQSKEEFPGSGEPSLPTCLAKSCLAKTLFETVCKLKL